MKTYFTSLTGIAIIVLLAVLTSCKKNDVKKIDVNSKWNVAVFDERITLGEFLDHADSTWTTWLSHDEEGNLYILYNDTIEEVITGEDVLYDLDTIIFEMHDEFSLKSSDNRDYLKIDSLAFIDLVFDKFYFESGEVKQGMINIVMSLDQTFNINKVVISTDDIKNQDGSGLKVEADYNFVTNNFETHINLEGLNFMLKENQQIVLSAEIYFNGFKPNAPAFNVDLEGDVSNLSLKSIYGHLLVVESLYNETIDVDFGLEEISGEFEMFTPKGSLLYQNTFGINGYAKFDSIYLKNVAEEIIPVLNLGDSATMEINTTQDNEYEEIGINNLVESVNVVDKYKSLTISGLAYLDGHAASEWYYISDDNKINLIASVEMPLSFKASELTYIDTVELNISDGDKPDVISEIEFNFMFDNALPLTIKPQMYLYKMEENIIVDSLILSSQYIKGCYDINNPKKSNIKVIVNEDRVNTVMNTDHLILKFILDTENNKANMNVNQYFNLRIGASVKSGSIEF